METGTGLQQGKGGLFEIFCVDISRSMWFTQSFPYLVGESKISMAKRIIAHPLPQDLTPSPHYSCLILFDSNPRIAVPIGVHTPTQSSQINASLEGILHGVGTALFKALNFCELQIEDFLKNHGVEFQVLLHVFTDGQDNSTNDDITGKRPYDSEFTQPRPDVTHRFYYSFSDFEMSKRIGEALCANVVMIGTDINSAIDLRNKHIFLFDKERKKKIFLKQSGAYNLLDGDNPEKLDININLVNQIKKFSIIFEGKILQEEGLFRQNAKIDVVEDTTERIKNQQDNLNDYDDPIQVAHTFKNFLRRYTLIPDILQKMICDIMQSSSNNKEMEVKDVLSGMPKDNMVCLMLVIEILRRVLNAQSTIDQSIAITDSGLATIFSGILFNEVLKFSSNENTFTALEKVGYTKSAILVLINNPNLFNSNLCQQYI